jgi:hypothetical protein
MALFNAIIVFFAVFLIGCSDENAKLDAEYNSFIKNREISKIGFDMATLDKALQLYPEYKRNGLGDKFDMAKFRTFTTTNTLNTKDYLPVFLVIKEVEDSLKTDGGKAFLAKKYPQNVVSTIKVSLKIYG